MNMVFTGRAPLAAVLEGLSTASPTAREGGVTSPSGVGTSASRSGVSSISSVTPARPSYATGTLPPRGESPLSFNDLLAQATTVSNLGGRKYRLWCVPVDSQDVCMGLIGEGASFCTIRGCTKTHRSQSYHVAVPGEAYVAKAADKAFVEPRLKTQHLTTSLFNSWKDLLITLDEWTSLFSLAQVDDTKDEEDKEVKFSLEDIKLKNEEETSAIAFKTPKKRKETELQSSDTEIPDYNPLVSLEGRDFHLDMAELHIDELDRRSVLLREVLNSRTLRYEKDHADSLSFFFSSEVKFARLFSALGKKPTTLDARFDAPNVWLSLATIAEEVNEKQGYLTRQIDNLKGSLSMKVNTSKLNDHHDKLIQRIDELETFAIMSTKKLQQNIVQMGSDLQSSVNTQAPSQTLHIDLIQRLEKMESEMKMLKSINDESSVKYGGLGFTSQRDSDAWIEANFPSDEYGLLMDFNLVLEHVYTQMAGQKILTNLGQIHKMKLSNNNQAVALTSFETRIPKVFCGESRSVGVVRDGDSYFKSIKSWDDWNTPNDGYRDQIKRELTVFEIGHKETMEAELESLSVFHTLCSKSLTDSVGWGHKLIKFIDDTYREYSRARYSSKKAWHVATKLGVALMEYIAKPRNVVHNSFRISNNLSVAKSVSYAHFRSLDLMSKVEVLEFKNSPIVTAELAKFLALNSSFESVEKLQNTIGDMSDSITKASKDSAAALKSANTIGNSVDVIKGDLKGFTKRIKTLEGARN